jgi:hypothetical protein
MRDGDDREFLLAEYEHVAEALLRNEEDGERRATFFVSVTGGLLALLGVLTKPDSGPMTVATLEASAGLVTTGLAVALVLGATSVARLAKRNVATDRYKLALRTLRRQFVTRDRADELRNALFGLYDPCPTRPVRAIPLTGAGWLDTLALLDALLAAGVCYFGVVAGATALDVDAPARPVTTIGAAAGAALIWLAQVSAVRRYYATELAADLDRDAESLRRSA